MKSYILWTLMIVSLSGCGIEVIDTGHRGVKTRFGEVVSDPLPEGLYFYNPITIDIHDLDVREQVRDGKTEVYTQDVQQVVVTYKVNYHPVPEQIHTIYRTVGRKWDDILLPQLIESSIKNTIGQWNALALVEDREKATRRAEAALIEAAAARYIAVTRLELPNLEYTDVFEAAVEAKVTAQQRAIEAQNTTVRVKEEASQKVIQAEAEATSMTIRAKALEENRGLVEWEAVQKWDGHLPTNMFGNAIPFLNFSTAK